MTDKRADEPMDDDMTDESGNPDPQRIVTESLRAAGRVLLEAGDKCAEGEFWPGVRACKETYSFIREDIGPAIIKLATEHDQVPKDVFDESKFVAALQEAVQQAASETLGEDAEVELVQAPGGGMAVAVKVTSGESEDDETPEAEERKRVEDVPPGQYL